MKFSRYFFLYILSGILLILTSCSSQNPVVNPSPGTWRIVHGENPGRAQNGLDAVAATSTNDAWAVGSYNSVFSNQQAQPLIEHWDGASWSTVPSPNIGTNNTSLSGVTLEPRSTKLWAVGSGAVFSTISVSSPTATQPTSVMSVTAETLIETCCS